jgi:signal transduction histidine kinase
MKVQTDPGKTEALSDLLNEARAEADALRMTLRVYEKTLLSSRLIMGHELKRPATAISGYLDLALEEIASKNTEAIVDVIEKAKNECGLLNELNTFFIELLKADGKPGEKEGQLMDVEKCVREIVDRFLPTLYAKDRISVQVSSDATIASFNLNAFKIILSNVIENALTYSDVEAPVNVVIEKTSDKRGMGEGQLLKIRVTDQGLGIPDDCLRRIFKPFVRLNGREQQGAGLGLTLVRSLVELHGGSVYVRSVEGEGTSVYITVPEIPARNGGAFVT